MRFAKIVIFIIMVVTLFGYSVRANEEIPNIILFEQFEFCDLKDNFLKQAGIDCNYVKMFDKNKVEITELNFRNIINNFENEILYEFKDIFGKKISKSRVVYILSAGDFFGNIYIDKNKYKLRDISVDIVYNDTLGNKILVGKFNSSPKIDNNKDCYMIKLNNNNKILWGKVFEEIRISKFLENSKSGYFITDSIELERCILD